MIDTDALRDRINEVLAILDGDDYPQLYDYFGQLACNDDDELDDVIAIEGDLVKMKPLPQTVWDFIVEMLELAADDGSADAMNDLGAMYYDGTGCEQSFEKAVYYYDLASQNGSRQAQENLGYCYYYGRNMPQPDYEKAFHYFALGAFDGHLISLYKIGDMYANGYYVPQNEKEAFCIYNRCMATMTDEAAKVVAGPVYLRLGKAFLYGKGTDIDAESALVCYQKAEYFLYEMVKGGNVMYKKSLRAAIDGQAKARALLNQQLPAGEWLAE